MNMMFSCIFGVGWIIVRYRKNGVLKRLKATPVRAIEFVSAQLVSRLYIVLITAAVVFGGSNIFLHFMMQGSYLNLLLITALATVCMISFGLIFAARLRSEELANGLMNLALWPMMAFSGIFFSLEGTPELLQRISRVFPLTHYIEASRAIMLDGAGIVDIMPNIIVLAGLTAVFLLISSLTFKWE
jgi:ABC-2 type transport system permease protein